MVWSPPSYSAHRSPSIQATTSSSTGEPWGLGVQRTPANLSPPDRAKFWETSSWPSASTFTQKRPISRSRGQVRDVRAGAGGGGRRGGGGEGRRGGGRRNSELNDWQVKPRGPSSVTAVSTVTPEAK